MEKKKKLMKGSWFLRPLNTQENLNNSLKLYFLFGNFQNILPLLYAEGSENGVTLVIALIVNELRLLAYNLRIDKDLLCCKS